MGLTIESAPTFSLAAQRVNEAWNLIVADLRLPNGSAEPLLRGRPAVLTTAGDPDEGRAIADRLGVPFVSKNEKDLIPALQRACLIVCPLATTDPPSSLRLSWAMLSLRARATLAIISLAFTVLVSATATIFGMGVTRGATEQIDAQHDREIAALKARVDEQLTADIKELAATIRADGDALRARMRSIEQSQAMLHGNINGLLIRLGVPRDALIAPPSPPEGEP